MKRFIALLVLAGLVGIGTWFFMRPPAIAPQVVFSTLSGQQLSTDQLRGKVVLVKFWATSCVTCIAQMPETIETYNKYHAQGFETIAVAMQYDPANYVINYAETKKLPFTVALDTRGTVAKAFGDIRLTPTSFLIDRQGAVIKRYLGDYDVNDFHRALEKALSAQPT